MYKDLKLDINSSCVPIFGKNRLQFSREEKNGYTSVVPFGQEIISFKLLNTTTNYILSLMNGKNTVNDIYLNLINRYGVVNASQIKKDISDIIKELWIEKIIIWKKGVNPFMENFSINLELDLCLRVAFEDDIKEIIEFLKGIKLNDNLIKFYSPIARLDDLTPLGLRSALFSMTKRLFLMERNGVMIGLVSLLLSPTGVATMDFAFLDEDKIDLLFNHLYELNNMSARYDTTKIRVFVNKIGDDIFKKALTANKFLYKCTLEKEINNIDVDLYDFIFEKK